MDASGLAYGLGFVLATATLHLIGVSLGVMAERKSGRLLVRAGAVLVASLGALGIAALMVWSCFS